MYKAVITGITGQDGAYLARHLLSLGYKVVGVKRRSSSSSDYRIAGIRDANFEIIEGDVTDESSIESIVSDFKPDEFYNLAAQSFVGGSWHYPRSTFDITGGGVLNCLEAVRKTRKQCRFYQAGSSEQYGNISDGSFKINEHTPFMPESPYAAAKVFGHHIVQVYRKSYNMFAVSATLFNHESPLRGYEFVSRKITRGLASIKHGLATHIKLGNINAKRDWGHSHDYCRAMHLMLQHETPYDFVIATGRMSSVSDFLELACKHFGLDSKEILRIDPALLRPNDVKALIGDYGFAKKKLGWEPKISLETLVESMCEYDDLDIQGNPANRAKMENII